ncbi:unnamed protein product, partial [Rotaria sordida]
MTTGDTHVVRIRKITLQHDDEKRELQQLNESFGMYIKRVKDLEDRNRQLHLQVDALKQNWGFDSIKIREKYNKDLNVFRKQLDTTTCDMQLSQIQAIRADQDKTSVGHQISFIQTLIAVDHHRASLSEQDLERSKAELNALRSQVEDKRKEIERSKDEMKRQLDYLHGLNKEFDNELMARVMLEVELQTFREELVFTRAVYEEELNDLALLGTYQIDVGQFYRDELTRAVANIKKDFEILARARYQEWEEYYRIKTESVQTEIAEQKRKKAEAGHSTDVK